MSRNGLRSDCVPTQELFGLSGFDQLGFNGVAMGSPSGPKEEFQKKGGGGLAERRLEDSGNRGG